MDRLYRLAAGVCTCAGVLMMSLCMLTLPGSTAFADEPVPGDEEELCAEGPVEDGSMAMAMTTTAPVPCGGNKNCSVNCTGGVKSATGQQDVQGRDLCCPAGFPNGAPASCKPADPNDPTKVKPCCVNCNSCVYKLVFFITTCTCKT
jgi:hypothetical protein